MGLKGGFKGLCHGGMTFEGADDTAVVEPERAGVHGRGIPVSC